MRRRLAVGLTFALILAGSAVSDPANARWLGSFAWMPDAIWAGGFSGIELSPDGSAMTVITDRAGMVTARIERTGDRITAIRQVRHVHLRSAAGSPLSGRLVDSEGLAVAPDGTLFVSFEGRARIARYDEIGGPAHHLPRPSEFDTLARNGALEALAIDARGRLYTLPERGLDSAGAIPVHRWDGRRWSVPFSLPAQGRFRPVGADFGPDGRFYLLERSASPLGFRSRLRRWTLTETAATEETTLLTTAPGVHGNLEGVAIWRAADGMLRATMIADNNFLPVQRSELVEYLIEE